MYADLLDLLQSLDRVRQDPRFHPEGDALFHSLQVFDCARRESDHCVLWASALLHDVGKAVSSPEHDVIGADLLEGLVSPRVVWLVRHHLDLLRAPRPTRRRLRGQRALGELERLRRFDLAGRCVRASVPTPEAALRALFSHRDARIALDPDRGPAAPDEDHVCDRDDEDGNGSEGRDQWL